VYLSHTPGYIPGGDTSHTPGYIPGGIPLTLWYTLGWYTSHPVVYPRLVHLYHPFHCWASNEALFYYPFHCWASKEALFPLPVSLLG